VLNSTGRGVFIGVQGGVTDLVKSVTHQVVIGWASHMVGATGSGLHRLLASDSLLPPLGECHHEADPQEAVKWARSATPWAH
jgi:hypothetical protein